MKVWCFAASGELRALTPDESGACLPGELGPWRLLNSIHLTGAAADEVEAAELIDVHGFCCFNAEGE